MKRIIPIITILALIVAVVGMSAVPVSAASTRITYDFLDLATFESSGDGYIATLDNSVWLVGDFLDPYWVTYIYNGNTLVSYDGFEVYGNSTVDYTFQQGYTTRLTVYPLGATNGDVSILSVANIPNGTEMTFAWDVQPYTYMATGVNPFADTSVYLTLRWYDASGNYLSEQSYYVGSGSVDQSYSYTVALNIPSGAAGFAYRYRYGNNYTAGMAANQSITTNFILRSSTVQFYTEDYNPTVEDQIKDGVDDLNDKLDDTNDKLDDVINGEASPEEPEGSQDVSDSLQSESDLLDNMADYFKEFDGIVALVMGWIPDYLPAFMVVSGIFSSFLELEFLRDLAYFAFVFGVCGSLINLIPALVNSGRSDARKHQRPRKEK